MIKLYGKVERLSGEMLEPQLFTLSTNRNLPERMRRNFAFLCDGGSMPHGYAAYVAKSGATIIAGENTGPVFQLPVELSYLADGDVVRVNPSNNSLHALFRKSSKHNTILLTEQCNHYCLMCSQPPKDIDDSWLMDEAMQLVELIPLETTNIGFSGGEPTLYGQRFIDLMRRTKNLLPATHVDVLSNGRAFRDPHFSRALGEVAHPNLTLGIPIYSDDPVRHDYVVQSDGAFDETIRGILNLKRERQRVEIRIVIHKQTVERLVETCEFIARNLLFVDHVALMGLEITGFTRANLDKLWVDPYEYQDILAEATHVLNSYGIKTSVYNHQLCVIKREVEANYTKSISDWKNEYVDACQGCSRMNDCGGFFSSSKMYRYSDFIKPFLT
ncbi:His-Xaa-Ser system radical SAM maturase HxsC [Polaromonas sp. YR568]|uniref:His-Xaa-Ser system radical SAM maturase HxsC n=1 Tax=Polaromonas sp. YR568 TaxID=1855301 RepID=UPI00398C1620